MPETIKSTTDRYIDSLKQAVKLLDKGLFEPHSPVELEPDERDMFVALTALFKQGEHALSGTVKPWLASMDDATRDAKEQAIYGDRIFYPADSDEDLTAGQYINTARILHRVTLNAQREMGDAMPANNHAFEHVLNKTELFLKEYGLVQLHTFLNELSDIATHIDDCLDRGSISRGINKLPLAEGTPEYAHYEEFLHLIEASQTYLSDRVAGTFAATPEAPIETEQTLIRTELPPPISAPLQASPYADKALHFATIEALSEVIETAESELGETEQGKTLVAELQAFCQQQHQREVG